MQGTPGFLKCKFPVLAHGPSLCIDKSFPSSYVVQLSLGIQIKELRNRELVNPHSLLEM